MLKLLHGKMLSKLYQYLKYKKGKQATLNFFIVPGTETL